MHTPSLADPTIRQSLVERSAPYWIILEYCRHIGIEKRQKRPAYWMARIRKRDGGYIQARLAVASDDGSDGRGYEAALGLAHERLARSEVAKAASTSHSVGSTQNLRYIKVELGFTNGDALVDLVEWKRIAATPKTNESLLSLINFNLFPRLVQIRLEDMTGRII